MKAQSNLTALASVATLAIGALLTACGDDSGSSTGSGGAGAAGGAGGTGTTDATTVGTGGAGGTSGTGGTGGGSAGPSFVVEFDAAQFQLPEGIAQKGTDLFVGFAPSGQVVKLAQGATMAEPFGNLPQPAPNGQGFMTGLAADAAGNVYAAMVSFAPMPTAGIYKIPAAGGNATLFASDPTMAFPNGLVFDADGNLFVTDSAKGAIFKITPAGVISEWIQDALLADDQSAPCGAGLGFPVGANGLALAGGAFYAANTGLASIVKIPVNMDGTAGTPSEFVATDCDGLAGVDGLAVDSAGTIYAAIFGKNQIASIDPMGQVTVISSGAPYDSPASLVLDEAAKTLFITNFAYVSATTMGGMPKPGILALPLP